MGWQEIDSTADKAIEIRSQSLKELFADAAYGMTGISCKRTPVDTNTRLKRSHIAIDAFDEESLLIDWLNEILAFIDETECCRGVFATQIMELSVGVERPYIVSNVVLASCFEPFGAVLKAATYHDIKIEELDDTIFKYTATITFDV